MANEPPAIHLGIDRTLALIRGLWRLAATAGLVMLLAALDVDWRLMWQTQKAVAVAGGVLVVVMGTAAGLFFIFGARWMLLTIWPGELGIHILPEHVSILAGPFGRREFDWSRIDIRIDQDLDQEMIDRLPDETFVPSMKHPACEEELTRRIQRLSGVSPERLTALLRPYLRRALDDIGPGSLEADGEADSQHDSAK